MAEPQYHLEPWVRSDGLFGVSRRTIDVDGWTDKTCKVLLPRDYHDTKIILQGIHELDAGFSGWEHTLACSRRLYCVSACHPLLNKILKDCIPYQKAKNLPASQCQGDLPPERITPGVPPLAFTLLDYFGPFTVTHMCRIVKRNVCIFTCLTIHAIHLQVLRSLDADSFLTAFTRFMVCNFGSSSPTVRCLKSDHTITLFKWIDDERLQILFCEIQDDVHDLATITPDHLLRVNPSDDLPPGGSLTDAIYCHKWKHAQYLADQFWIC